MRDVNEIGRTEDRLEKQLVEQPQTAAMVGGFGYAATALPEKDMSLEWHRRRTIGKTVEAAVGSLQRIHEATQLSLREEAGPLLKSDLDNAAKHANQLARHIRTIKKALFPVVDKPLPEVKTEQ